jgi:hypothetical protein
VPDDDLDSDPVPFDESGDLLSEPLSFEEDLASFLEEDLESVA